MDWFIWVIFKIKKWDASYVYYSEKFAVILYIKHIKFSIENHKNFRRAQKSDTDTIAEYGYISV